MRDLQIVTTGAEGHMGAWGTPLPPNICAHWLKQNIQKRRMIFWKTYILLVAVIDLLIRQWYCMSKKKWPILYSNLLYKIGHYFLDRRYLYHLYILFAVWIYSKTYDLQKIWWFKNVNISIAYTFFKRAEFCMSSILIAFFYVVNRMRFIL